MIRRRRSANTFAVTVKASPGLSCGHTQTVDRSGDLAAKSGSYSPDHMITSTTQLLNPQSIRVLVGFCVLVTLSSW